MSDADSVSELIEIVDRLEDLMERSALSEMEIEVGTTTLTLRSPSAVAPRLAVADSAPTTSEAVASNSPAVAPEAAAPGAHSIAAPLTGVFYLSPSPDAEPYVREGVQINVGQVIGLIEAMKLFNEIKSDVAGTVRRLVASDGDLVKAKQVLIEVDVS